MDGILKSAILDDSLMVSDMDDTNLNAKFSEEDTKNRYISPAIENAGWVIRHDCRMEYRITDGRIDIDGSTGLRNKKSVVRADCVLFHKSNPLAVIEAKDLEKSETYGLQQAMNYAEKSGLHLPMRQMVENLPNMTSLQ